MKILNDELENTTTCRCDHVNTGQLKELILKYSEAKAVDSLYAICNLHSRNRRVYTRTIL